MDRRAKIIIGLFAVVLLGIIITEIARPKPINWQPSYTANDKIPFGCYVLYEELSVLFPQSEVQRIDESAYSALVERDSTRTANYLFINTNLNFDQQETNQLLDFVQRGNDVFMAATYFGNLLSDTLNIEVASDYAVQQDTMLLNLTNNAFPGKNYAMDRGHYKTHFTSVDTTNTTLLGHLKYFKKNVLSGAGNTETKINFIRVNFGQGHFFMHTTPQAFTNYYMLEENQQYVANVMSYLNEKTILWDNYKKVGRIIIDSPMRFVLNQPALKWGYYLTMAGLLVFVIFRAKREQRIIPVIRPLPNTSVDFAKTIGGLYHQRRDCTNLIAKKLNYFLEYIRANFYLNITTITEKTAIDLASKSGKSITETKDLLDYIVFLKNKNTHSENDLIQLNRKIASFKQ